MSSGESVAIASRRRTQRGGFVALGAFVALACSSGPEAPLEEPFDGSAVGGGFSAGGHAALGGMITGGARAIGGSLSSGGAHASGGSSSGGRGAIGGSIGGVNSTGGRASGGATSESTGGAVAAGGHDAVGGASGTCPASGKITYSLTKADNPTADQASAYAKIDEAMSKAVEFYNCYTDITKAITAQYVPSVATADGNPNGSIRFGKESYMTFVTAMHEISHVVGVGADNRYDQLIQSGVYTGPIATARLRELTADPEAEIHGDAQHFWPYGLNYDSEWHSEQDGIFHCYLVTAIREDMGWQ
jgi:hypothetical protein